MKKITLVLPDNLNISEEEVRQLLAAKLVQDGRLSPEQAKQWPASEATALIGRPTTEAEAAEIKHLVGLYYAEKATRLFDELWDQNGWTAETMQEWVQEHMRTPYQRDSAA